MEQAVAIDDQMIGQVFSIGSERQRMVYLQTFKENLDLFLSFISEASLDLSFSARQAGVDVVLKRKALAAEALAVQREALLGGRYPNLAPKLEALLALRQQIAQKLLTGPSGQSSALFQKNVTQWRAQQETLEAELARLIPEMDLSQKLQNVDRRIVAEALPKATALIEFIRFRPFDFAATPAKGGSWQRPDRYLAFVVIAGQPEAVQLVDLGQAKPIDQLIARYRTRTTGDAEDRGAIQRVKSTSQPAQGSRHRKRAENGSLRSAAPGPS